MRDKYENVIYIGKAVILKNRVKQYFGSSSNQSPKVKFMVLHIAKFEYIVTDSELEALILECNMIKKYKPRFNVLLKDDKHYPYIKVTMNEAYPRILITRKMEKDGAKYFGPYPNVKIIKETINIMKKIFPMKTCNRALPADIGKQRPCLNFHIKQCLGPCQGNIEQIEYKNTMNDVCKFLNGRYEEILRDLKKNMKYASDNMNFELAAYYRDKINSIKAMAEKQKVFSVGAEEQDVIAMARGENEACIQVFFVRGGRLIGREHFLLSGTVDIENMEIVASFIKQFYSQVSYIPKEIILQSDMEEIKIIEEWLSSKKESRVHIRVPRKGDKMKLVDMVARNAEISLGQHKNKALKKELFSSKVLGLLKDILDLKNMPLRIEAYDISNTGSTDIVASMVVFEDGIPSKKEYRKFKIRYTKIQNDYLSMQEVIHRRFTRSNVDDGKFSKLPNLILIDGGLGHINSVIDVLCDLHIDIPVAGMVKDNKHRTRGLIYNNKEIDLSDKKEMLIFIASIQSEAHRFALEYNKKLREKRYRKSLLDEIDGIGESRKKALIKNFGSIKKIQVASVDDIIKVQGFSKELAQKVVEFFEGRK